MTPARRRRGRPAGGGNSREAVLVAARRVFTSHGYDRGSLRMIAAEAGVDARMVRHFFGDKEGLFRATLDFPVDPAQVIPALLDGGLDGLGERVVRFFLSVWERDGEPGSFVGLMRGATSHDASASLLREFITRTVLGPVAAALGRPDAQLRVSLVASQLVGLGLARYIMRIEPMASADHETLVAGVAPTVQRYLDGDLTGARAAPVTAPRPTCPRVGRARR